MKKKQEQRNKKIFLLLCILLGVILLLILVFRLVKFEIVLPAKTYHSKFLKITFKYPAKYQLEERFTDIVLINSKGKIIISRTGTNFEKLNDHVNSLSKLNRFTIVDKEEFIINNYPAITGLIDNKKYYFIYPTTWTVFSLSTSSVALYPDLDQIAQSFRYTP